MSDWDWIFDQQPGESEEDFERRREDDQALNQEILANANPEQDQAARDEWQAVRDEQMRWQRHWDEVWARHSNPEVTRAPIINAEWFAIRTAQAIESGSLSPAAATRVRWALQEADARASSATLARYLMFAAHVMGADTVFDDHADWVRRHSAPLPRRERQPQPPSDMPPQHNR